MSLSTYKPVATMITCREDDEEAMVMLSAYRELECENAALRKMLSDADELERYTGSNGKCQWGKCSAWIKPDDAVVIISAKALDAARNEEQP